MLDTDLVAMLLNSAEDGECEIHIHIGREVTVGVRRGYVGDFERLSRENVMGCKDPTNKLYAIVRRLIGAVVNHRDALDRMSKSPEDYAVDGDKDVRM